MPSAGKQERDTSNNQRAIFNNLGALFNNQRPLCRTETPDPLKLSRDVPAEKIESFSEELKLLVDKFK